jgi:hypothetical protein
MQELQGKTHHRVGARELRDLGVVAFNQDLPDVDQELVVALLRVISYSPS